MDEPSPRSRLITVITQNLNSHHVRTRTHRALRHPVTFESREGDFGPELRFITVSTTRWSNYRRRDQLSR
jgi:hypothetical protein